MGILEPNTSFTCECGGNVFTKENHILLNTSKYTSDIEEPVGSFYRCVKCNKTYSLSAIKMLSAENRR